jgi:hypothetical protein
MIAAVRKADILRWEERERIISRIGSPVAAKLIDAAHQQANSYGVNVRYLRTADYLKRFRHRGPEAVLYRDWVQDRLRESDLARQLPSGLDMLPDIYEQMGEPWRGWAKLKHPSNTKDLVRHMVRHLEWYLDPTQKPKPPIREIGQWVWVGVFIALVGLSQFLHLEVHGFYWVAKGAAVLLTLALARSIGGHTIGEKKVTDRRGNESMRQRRVHNFHESRELINAAELYYYLVDQYAEPENDAPPAAELSEDLQPSGQQPG